MWATYEYTAWSTQLCLYDVRCGGNESRSSLEVVKNSNNSDYRPDSFNHTVGADVTYRCGLGRRFKDSTSQWIEDRNYTCLETVMAP